MTPNTRPHRTGTRNALPVSVAWASAMDIELPRSSGLSAVGLSGPPASGFVTREHGGDGAGDDGAHTGAVGKRETDAFGAEQTGEGPTDDGDDGEDHRRRVREQMPPIRSPARGVMHRRHIARARESQIAPGVRIEQAVVLADAADGPGVQQVLGRTLDAAQVRQQAEETES